MDLSPYVFRPVDVAHGPAGTVAWAALLATVAARQAASPTARAQTRLSALAARPDGAFARRVAAALAREAGMNEPFTPPFQPMFNGRG